MNLKIRREVKIFIWKTHLKDDQAADERIFNVVMENCNWSMTDLCLSSVNPCFSPVLHPRQQLCPGQRTGPVPLPHRLLLRRLLRADWFCPRWADAKELLVLLPVRQRDQRAPHFADAGGLGRAEGVQDGDHLVQEERWGLLAPTLDSKPVSIFSTSLNLCSLC